MTEIRCFAVACVIALLAFVRQLRPGDFAILCLAAVPVAAAFACSLTGVYVFVLRYFAMAQPFMLITAAALINRLRGFEQSLVIAVVIVGAALSSLPSVMDPARLRQLDARSLATFLDSHRSGRDIVIVSSTFTFFPVLYHSSNREHIYLSNGLDQVVHYAGRSALTIADAAEPALLVSLHGRRIWLVTQANQFAVSASLPTTWRERARHADWAVSSGSGGVIIIEYEAP